ncbi:MAG: response regulator transcription factor [Burkholderiaceae bacterium]
MRILVVDDHPLIHEALGLIMSTYSEGVSHESAAGFAEACNRLARDPAIDLLLLDLGLPGFQAIGALTEMRSRFPEVPVVVISAREEADIIHAALDAGAMGFVPKTFKPDAIKMALRYVAAGGVFVPHQVLGTGATRHADLVDNANASDVSVPLSDDRVRDRLNLTPRQFEVLQLLVSGMTNKRIARKMGLSDNTIKAHVGAVLRSLDASNRTEAVVMASRHGLRVVS